MQNAWHTKQNSPASKCFQNNALMIQSKVLNAPYCGEFFVQLSWISAYESESHEHLTCIMCLSRCTYTPWHGRLHQVFHLPKIKWCSHLAPVKQRPWTPQTKRPTKIDINVCVCVCEQQNSTTKIINPKLELFGIEKALLVFWSPAPGKIENSCKRPFLNEYIRTIYDLFFYNL